MMVSGASRSLEGLAKSSRYGGGGGTRGAPPRGGGGRTNHWASLRSASRRSLIDGRCCASTDIPIFNRWFSSQVIHGQCHLASGRSACSWKCRHRASDGSDGSNGSLPPASI